MMTSLDTQEPAAESRRFGEVQSFNALAELGLARALAEGGKRAEALAQYERILSRFPGEEARCRYGLLLEDMGQAERAKRVFREVVSAIRGAPSYYRKCQSEWLRIARQHL